MKNVLLYYGNFSIYKQAKLNTMDLTVSLFIEKSGHVLEDNVTICCGII